jgi:thioredoxin 1
MAYVLRIILGIALGAAGGYGLSWLLCLRGGCPLTSNRPLMMVMGGLLGLWLATGGYSALKAGQPVSFGKDLTTPEQFAAQVTQAGGPALVDFYTPACPPCRRLAPILAELEKQYQGRIAFFRVDAGRADALAAEHRIQAVPTLLLYRSGRQTLRIEGLRSKEDLTRLLDGLLTE